MGLGGRLPFDGCKALSHLVCKRVCSKSVYERQSLQLANNVEKFLGRLGDILRINVRYLK